MNTYLRTKDFNRKTNDKLTLMYKYICKNCRKSYVPRRRGAQKYCSNSCRSRAYQIRKGAGLKKPLIQNQSDKENTQQSNNTINPASITNAMIGAFGYDAIKGLLTPSGSKSVTRKDLQVLIEKLDQRYIPLRNIPLRNDGTYAFCDKKTESLVYLKIKQNGI